jgi:hypothetical protein
MSTRQNRPGAYLAFASLTRKTADGSLCAVSIVSLHDGLCLGWTGDEGQGGPSRWVSIFGPWRVDTSAFWFGLLDNARNHSLDPGRLQSSAQEDGEASAASHRNRTGLLRACQRGGIEFGRYYSFLGAIEFMIYAGIMVRGRCVCVVGRLVIEHGCGVVVCVGRPAQ